ncbi:hypothetical protein [Gordonibacter pamelaeae]|uniref:hypothetical protein n=1 Tax=Gordonibacter pamelaeae TaxID=471189 RepID=UPI00243023E7|nr:hypothetical protein [Gordonibacter pamelaeae]
MSRKNKIMAAIAAGALVLLVGSGVARCSLASADGPAPEDAPQQQQSQEQRYPDFSEPEGQGGASAPEQAQGSAFEALVGTSWVAEDDPTSTLSIVSGAFVEKSGKDTIVTYWTIDSEDAGSAVLLASKSMTEAASPVTATIEEAGGTTVIRCDALSHAYKQVQAGARTLYFSGVTSKLAESLGCELTDIESAVSLRAAAVSPACERAVWDAEVWIDYANNTATTTFALDDGASTLISVTRSPDGTIEAL